MKEQKKSAARRDDTGTGPFIKTVLILVAVAIVIVAAYSILSSTGTLKRMSTAYTVGGIEFTAMDMTIHYYDVRSSLLNQYGSTLQAYGYTLDSSLDAQTCMIDTSMTWKEYFLKSAREQAQQVAVLTKEAQTAGYEMTDEDTEQYQTYLDTIKTTAKSNDMSVAKYITSAYGTGVKLSDVEKVYKQRFYASGYYDSLLAGYDISDADVTAYYNDHKTTYDKADAYYYSFTYTEYTYTEGSTPAAGQPTSADEATKMTEESKAAAKAKADAVIAAATGADDFDAAVKTQIDSSTDFTTALNTKISLSATDERTTWLADDARVAGDKTVVENTTNKSYDAVLFVSRYADKTQAATVRHILFMTQTAAQDATDEETAAIKTANEKVKADLQALYDEWKAGDATEDSFAALAKEKSQDTGSAYKGGLYEHFSEGTMETAFNDWSFDASRKPGDTEIIETSYGYHLMYFVSADGDYLPYEIKDTLRSDKYNEWYEKVSPTYEAKVSKLGMNLVG